MTGVAAPVFAGGALPAGLGDGRPGLCIIYEATNEYVVFVDDAFAQSWKTGKPNDCLPVCRLGHVKVLAECDQEPKALNIAGLWNGHAFDLFPFDEQTVFTCDGFIGASWAPRESMVFSTNANSILISTNVYAMSRRRYGLTTNQWFLGKIGPNIFYFETGKPRLIYFRTPEGKQRVNYFKLPRADSEVYGIKRAVTPGKDIGVFVDRDLSWLERLGNLGTAMAQPSFVEFSFREAKSKRMTQR